MIFGCLKEWGEDCFDECESAEDDDCGTDDESHAVAGCVFDEVAGQWSGSKGAEKEWKCEPYEYGVENEVTDYHV